MSATIRLTRMGAMKRPFYRIVVLDSRKRRDGRYLENLGTYNPVPAQAEITLKEDRILYWLGEGVQMSNTVESLLRSAGILEKHSLLKSGVSPEELDSRLEEWKSKQPKPEEGRLSRADKKAQKKTDIAAAKAAEEAAAKAAEEGAAKAAEEEAAAAKAAEEAAAAEETPAEEAGTEEEAGAEEAPAEEAAPEASEET